MSEESDEVLAFLEHYGVPGMKWGVRRARTRKQGQELSPQQQRVKKERNKMVARAAVGVAVAAGATFVGYQISKSGGAKASDLTKFEGHMRAAAKHRQQFTSGSSVKIPKSSGSKFTSEGAKTIAQMKAHRLQSIREANEQLKKGYESLQTPFPLREYLEER